MVMCSVSLETFEKYRDLLTCMCAFEVPVSGNPSLAASELPAENTEGWAPPQTVILQVCMGPEILHL